MTKSIFVFLYLLFIINPLLSNTYYVKTDGNNSNNGLSWTTAKSTIAAGISLMSPGDILLIKSGTYNEGIDPNKSGTKGNPIVIMTDDGNGNPGIVTLTGTVSSSIWGGGSASIVLDNNDYIEINGRQPDGFVCTVPTSCSWGALAYDPGDNSNSVSLKNIRFNGSSLNGSAPENHVVTIYGYNDPEVAYCTFNIPSGTNFVCEIGSDGGASSGPSPTSGGKVHHNVFLTGSTDQGYSVISILRHDDTEVYNNYIQNISGTPAVLRARQCHGNKFYNNVIWINSGRTYMCVFEYRGYSTGSGYADRNEFYNNTVIVEGSISESVVLISDYADDNKTFNNLIIGNIGTFVGGWTYLGNSNEIYNNTVTGSVTRWFENSSCQNTFDVIKDNTSSTGTGFITLSGSRPSPYWDLSADKNGASISSLQFDFNDQLRNNPPDVGAFEYGDIVTNPGPSKPSGVVVNP
jgi:hypothetical protein